MQNPETTFLGAGDAQLFAQSWLPDGPAKAAIVIVHGFGEHSGRYSHVVDYLLLKNYALYSYDHRGHGRSPGQRGHINSWAEYRTDLERFVAYVQSQTKLPLFIFAHSMGALIALEYLLAQPKGLAGAVISGAPIQPGNVAPPLKVLAARLLSKITPTLSMPFGDGSKGNLSRDPKVQTDFDNDPLTHNTVTVRWGAEILEALERVKTAANKIQVPILLVHGGADPMNLPQGVQNWIGSVGSKDKNLKIYPENRHEVHNDYDYLKLMQDVEAWLSAHL